VRNPAAKWGEIATALQAAAGGTGAAGIHLNFTSGYQAGRFGIPDIPAVANAINPKLAGFFGSAKPGCYGWILMDFATAELAGMIYKTNTPEAVRK